MPPWLEVLSPIVAVLRLAPPIVTPPIRRGPRRTRCSSTSSGRLPIPASRSSAACPITRRPDRPGRSAGAIREEPIWKSIVLSATHCSGGSVPDDVGGAPIGLLAGRTLLGDRVIAFQCFPASSMRNVCSGEPIWDAAKTNSQSLDAVEGLGLAAPTRCVLLPAVQEVVLVREARRGMPTLGLSTTSPADLLFQRVGIKNGI